jgi:hypothetical protein
MNAQKLLQLIQDPERAQTGDLRDLEQLVEDFPAFHAARMVHLKVLQLTGNYRQATYLPKAAAYLPDRVVLKRWMEGEDAQGQPTVPLQFLHQSPVEVPDEPVVREATPIPDAPPLPVVEAPIVELPQAIAVVVPDVPSAPAAALPEPPQRDADWDTLDPVAKAKRILERNRAMRAGLNQPITPPLAQPEPTVVEAPTPAVELEPEPLTWPAEEVFVESPEVAIEVVQEVTPVVATAVPEPAVVQVHADAKMTFAEWLAKGARTSMAAEPASAVQVEPVVPQVASPATPPVAEVTSRALIDRFLDQPPVLKPKKDAAPAPVPNPMPYAGQALVTETLAQLYFAQGHLALAEEAYEILKLKYPEKSSFFAARIREIKALRKT